jgi:hypothetical protein
MRPPPPRDNNNNNVTMRRRCCVVLTHFVRPSTGTHDNDAASPSPSSRPHQPRPSLHTQQQQRHLTLAWSSPTAPHASVLALTSHERPRPRALALSSQSPSGGLAHPRPLTDPCPHLLFAPSHPPCHMCCLPGTSPSRPSHADAHPSTCWTSTHALDLDFSSPLCCLTNLT